MSSEEDITWGDIQKERRGGLLGGKTAKKGLTIA